MRKKKISQKGITTKSIKKWLILAVAVFLLGWGIWYLFLYQRGIRPEEEEMQLRAATLLEKLKTKKCRDGDLDALYVKLIRDYQIYADETGRDLIKKDIQAVKLQYAITPVCPHT